MFKIMFVCLGNICRSAMAECVMKQLVKECGLQDKIFVDSAGTSDEEEGNGIYPPAGRKLEREGIEVVPHAAKQLKASDYDKYDLFLCAEQRNATSAARILGSTRKIELMLDHSENLHGRNIADPWYSGDFDSAYNDIYEACISLLKFLTDKRGNNGSILDNYN